MSAAPTDLRRYLIALVSLTLVQVMATLAFNQASVLAPAAAPDLGVEAADVAYYISLVYLAAMLSTLGGGAISRRTGPIRFIQIGLSIAAVGSFIFAVVASASPRSRPWSSDWVRAHSRSRVPTSWRGCRRGGWPTSPSR